MGKDDKKNKVDRFESEGQQELSSSVKVIHEVQKPVQVKNSVVKIGLVNRTNYDLTITFVSNKPEDIVMLAPSVRTKKEFPKHRIQSINGLSLIDAQRKGLVSIIN